MKNNKKENFVARMRVEFERDFKVNKMEDISTEFGEK